MTKRAFHKKHDISVRVRFCRLCLSVWASKASQNLTNSCARCKKRDCVVSLTAAATYLEPSKLQVKYINTKYSRQETKAQQALAGR